MIQFAFSGLFNEQKSLLKFIKRKNEKMEKKKKYIYYLQAPMNHTPQHFVHKFE